MTADPASSKSARGDLQHLREMPPKQAKSTVRVQAIEERAALEITFPRVEGYRVELPEERIVAKFSNDSQLVLTPEEVGHSVFTGAGDRHPRSAIIRLVSAIARAGLSPFGHVLVQFMIVWQR